MWSTLSEKSFRRINRRKKFLVFDEMMRQMRCRTLLEIVVLYWVGNGDCRLKNFYTGWVKTADNNLLLVDQKHSAVS